MPSRAVKSSLLGPFTFTWDKPGHEARLVTELPPNHRLRGTRVERLLEEVGRPDERIGHRRGPWLLGDLPFSENYSPLAVPGLHRRFARLERQDKALLRFVRTYGFLGHGPLMTDGTVPRAVRCEAVGIWRQQIAHMKSLLELWDHVQRKWLRWGEPIVKGGIRKVTIADNVIADFELGEFPPGWRKSSDVKPAYYYICLKVNERLRGHVSPFVSPVVRGDVLMSPECLLSAMYLQFALELTGKTRPAVVCNGCGRYFSPLHGTQRYCEDACRKRRWWREHNPPSRKPNTR